MTDRANPWNLTPREMDAMDAVIKFGSNKAVGRAMGLAHTTVAPLIFKACQKMGLNDRVVAAVAWDRITRN